MTDAHVWCWTCGARRTDEDQDRYMHRADNLVLAHPRCSICHDVLMPYPQRRPDDDPRSLLDATVDRHTSVCGRHDSGQNLEECRCGDPRRAVHQLADALRDVLDLHRPDPDEPHLCAVDRRPLPCGTIRVITTALEGDHG